MTLRIDRDPRYAMEIAVELVLGDVRWTATTDDVGIGGVFVATSVVGTVRERVEVVLSLPFGLGQVSGYARVVHVVQHAVSERAAGMGLAWDDLDDNTSECWASFIGRVAEHEPELPVEELLIARQRPLPPDRVAQLAKVLGVGAWMFAFGAMLAADRAHPNLDVRGMDALFGVTRLNLWDHRLLRTAFTLVLASLLLSSVALLAQSQQEERRDGRRYNPLLIFLVGACLAVVAYRATVT